MEIKISTLISWVVTLGSLIHGYQCFRGTYCLHSVYGSNMFLRKVGNYPQDYTVPQHRKSYLNQSFVKPQAQFLRELSYCYYGSDQGHTYHFIFFLQTILLPVYFLLIYLKMCITEKISFAIMKKKRKPQTIKNILQSFRITE